MKLIKIPIRKQGLEEALSIPQKDFQRSKIASDKNILPFISTFNPNNPNIYSTVKFVWKIIAGAAFIISA